MALVMIATTLFALPFTAQAKAFYCGPAFHEISCLDDFNYYIGLDYGDSYDATFVLTNDIKETRTDDCTVDFYEYQGNTDVVIDLNGYDINVTSFTAANLFTITGRHDVQFINSKSSGGKITFTSSVADQTSVIYVDNKQASIINYNCDIVSGTPYQTSTTGISSVIRARDCNRVQILGGSLVNEKYNSDNVGYDITITNSGDVILAGNAVLKAKGTNVSIYANPTMSIYDCKMIATSGGSTPRINYPIGSSKKLGNYLSSDTRVVVNSVEKSGYADYNVNTITDAQIDFMTSECQFSNHTDKTDYSFNVGHIYICSTCKAYRGLTDHDMQVTSETPATCTTKGKKTLECSYCTLKMYDYTPASHTPVTINGKAATCTSTGLTSGKQCSACGEILIPQKEIPKLSHSLKTTTTNATYAKAGKQVTACTVCGTVTETKTLPKLKVSATSISKVTSPKKKQIKVSWKRNKKVSGYKVQIATDKKFTKNVTTVTIKKNSTTSSTIKGLKSKKKYYVRLQSFKTEGSKKYYSSWSKTKSIKVK